MGMIWRSIVFFADRLLNLNKTPLHVLEGGNIEFHFGIDDK